jgi:hypothetical protein
MIKAIGLQPVLAKGAARYDTGSVVPQAVPGPLVGLGFPAFLAIGAGLLGAQPTRLKRYRPVPVGVEETTYEQTSRIAPLVVS